MADVLFKIKQKISYYKRLIDTGTVDPTEGLPIMAEGIIPLGPNGLPVPSGSKADPITVTAAGSVGTDHSANKPELPKLPNAVGAAFGGASIYAAYILIAKIDANPARRSFWAQNQSASPVVMLYHDGTQVTVDGDLHNAGLCLLGEGGGAGSQGADTPRIFDNYRGACLFYAPAGSQVAILEL